MHLYPIDGAVRRVPKDATPWNTREATWSMVIAGIDADPKQADALKTWGAPTGRRFTRSTSKGLTSIS